MSKPETKNEEIKQLVLTTDPDNVSQELLNKFDVITSLDLAWSDFKNIDILVNFPNLTHLDLRGCDALENLDIVSSLINLTSLNLACCSKLQDLGGLASLTNLTSLDLSSCESLQNIESIVALPNLNKLIIATAYDQKKSIQLPDLIDQCVNLEHLDLSGYDFTLPSGLGRLTRLKIFSLGSNNRSSNIGDDTLQLISELINLEELDLWKCKNITDRGLVYLSKNLNLKRLDLIGTNATDEAVNKLKDKLPGLTILWRLFEQTLSVCKDPATDPDELERIFNIFMYADYPYEDWITYKSPGEELEYVHLIGLATALAGNPQCPSPALADLFDFPNDREYMDWPDDNLLQLNVLSNPGCPLGVLYDVIRCDNDELKEAASKSPAVKKLKPVGFGRYADPETGEKVAKMQDGKLVAVEK